MKQKVAFITGANRGIGYETARQLGQQGIYPVIGARNWEQGKAAVAKLAAEGIEADSIPFDVLNKKDHAAAYTYLNDKFGRLDILVNNAGVSLEGEPADAFGRKDGTTGVSEEALRGTFESNFFGVVWITQALLPLLKKSEAGRIVNVSSALGSLTYHATSGSPVYDIKMFAYNASKTALNAFTVHLAYDLQDTAIKVNSIHPGWVQTPLGGKGAPMSIEEGAKTGVRLATIPADGPTGGYFHFEETVPW